MKTGFRIASVASLAALFFQVGCAAGAGEPTDPAPGQSSGTAAGSASSDVVTAFIATVASREATGIARWEVRASGETVVGFGVDGSPAWTFTVGRAPSDPGHVDLSAVSPETGKLTLARDGSIAGTASPRFNQVAAAFYADAAAQESVNPSAKSMPASAAAGKRAIVAEGSLSLAYEGDIYLGWNLWGYSFNVPEGGFCSKGSARVYGNAYMNYGSGSCFWSGWADSPNSGDCTIQVNVSEYGAQTGSCHWEVFQTP